MKRLDMHKQTVIAFVCVAALAVFPAAAANFPVGTHLIKGTLKDWQNKVLTSSAAVTIQAVATNGTVIASTKVANPSAEGYNFLLQIPLSSKATDSTAAVGDKLNCVLVQESGLSLAAEQLPVGEANAVSTYALAFVNTRSYTNDVGDTVSIPTEYVDTIGVWMEAYGIAGDYKPFEDYDGDNVSNYAEYCAGTTPSLTNPQWTLQPVKKTATDAEHEQVMPSADEDDVGITTIYVVPAEGAASQFFKLEAK